MQRSLVYFAIVAAVLCPLALVGVNGQPGFNVLTRYNSILVNLACGQGDAAPLGFDETLQQFTLMNLAAHQGVTLLTGSGNENTVGQAVAAYAGHYILVNNFRYLQGALDEVLFNVTAALNASGLPDAALKQARILGQTVAKQLLNVRQNEGGRFTANDLVYPSATQALAGEWSYDFPSPDYVASRLPTSLSTAAARTFVLPDPEAYRKEILRKYVPPRVNPSGSQAVYNAQYNRVKSLGSASSTARTAAQTESVAFWAGITKGSVCNPLTTWVNATLGALPSTITIGQTAELFAKMGVAASDVAILAAHMQYTFRFWRPVDAIKRGDTNNAADPTWRALTATPPTPEYPSEDAMLASALQTVLASFSGLSRVSPVMYGGIARPQGQSGPEIPAEVEPAKQYTTWLAAATDQANSGLWGGVHFNVSIQDGMAIGKRAANYVLDNFDVRTPTGTLTDLLSIDFESRRIATQAVARPPRYIV